MTNYKNHILLGLILFLSIPSLGAVRKWNAKMQELSDVMEELLPELYRSKPNVELLEKDAKKLTGLVHSLGLNPGGMTILPPDADPSLNIIRGLLERETKRAHQALKSGYVEYARGILRTTTGYCIACHSRNTSGPDFAAMILPAKGETLSSFEKAQFFAATRQFDGALEVLTQISGDEAFQKSRPFEWNRAVRQGLTLAVRVKQSPDKTLEILDQVKKVSAPSFIGEDAIAWRAAAVAWKAETSKPAVTEVALHRQAEELINKARKLQKFPIDRSGDIFYLRATAVLHHQLQNSPDGKFSADALYLLGKAYEVLGELEGTPWHEMYYESCIRKVPNTRLAKLCYESYESSIYFGYAGSGGFALPEDVQTMLSELRVMAMPKKK